MGSILLLAYFILGYWAVGQTVYANSVMIYSSFYAMFMKKLIIAMFFGWILIPAALIKRAFLRR